MNGYQKVDNWDIIDLQKRNTSSLDLVTQIQQSNGNYSISDKLNDLRFDLEIMSMIILRYSNAARKEENQ